MTNQNPTDPPAIGQDDPRFGFAVATQAVGNLIEATEALPAATLDNSTPCAEYAVSDLLDHIVMVMRRVAAIGNGDHWSTIEPEALGSGWADHYRTAAHAVQAAWTDAAKLGQEFEVPWGSIAGAPLMLTYTAELAVHGWDLATATDQGFAIDDELLAGPLMAAKFIPAEGRDTPEIPFDPVVDPGPDAPVLDQLAGWMGRKVV